METESKTPGNGIGKGLSGLSLSKRRYITADGKTLEGKAGATAPQRSATAAMPMGHEELRNLAQTADYQLEKEIAKGAESVLYIGNLQGHTICVKAIRNWVNKVFGDSMTRNQVAKLADVPYRTKVRHLENEFQISKNLFSNDDGPLLHIYALRKVRKLGVEAGYDMIMEYINGHDLLSRDLIREMTMLQKIKIFYDSVAALGAMHKKRLVHLDIKPSNFMINTRHQIKLLDFGVSVLSGWCPKAITGTGGYLSPEQICKEPLDEKTDLFALGMTFVVFFGGGMLNNQTSAELMKKQTRLDAKRRLDKDGAPSCGAIPELDGDFDDIADIIRNCTISRRDMRPMSCDHILAQINAACKKNGWSL